MTHSQILRFLIPLCLVSCNSPQIEKEFPTNEEQVAIGFKASFYQSRAIATLTEVQSNGFAVWGGYDGNNLFDYDNDGNPVKVTYNSSTQEWGYGTSKYWEQDKQYTFFATYPYDKYNGSVTNENGTYMVTIETPEDADTDYLTASAYADPNSANFNPEVPFQFNHLMTKINIQIEQDFDENPYVNYRFRVNSATLSNVKGKGTLTAVVTSNNTSHSWKYESTPMTFTYTGSGTGTGDFDPAANDGNKLMLFGDEGLMLLPQPTGSIMLDLNYEFGVVDINNNNTVSWESKTAPMNLPTGTWVEGTSVNYIITLNESNEIKVNQVTVATWGSSQSGGTIIIK